MKKNKLLIPILGIATTAGVITPIVVSCNKNSKKQEIDVTNKSIVTTNPKSVEFEFVWNSYSKTKHDDLTITNMLCWFGPIGGPGYLKELLPSECEQIANGLKTNGKTTAAIRLTTSAGKTYSADFTINYQVNDGDVKEVTIDNIIVIYEQQQ